MKVNSKPKLNRKAVREIGSAVNRVIGIVAISVAISILLDPPEAKLTRYFWASLIGLNGLSAWVIGVKDGGMTKCDCSQELVESHLRRR